jgi:hypothetical protein
VGEAVDISRCEDKAATQRKRIGPKFVPMVAGRAGAIAAHEIVAPKHVKQIGRTQVGESMTALQVIGSGLETTSLYIAMHIARNPVPARVDTLTCQDPPGRGHSI